MPQPLIRAGTPNSIAGSLDTKLGILAITVPCFAPDIESAILSPVPDIGIYGLVEWQPRGFTEDVSGAGYRISITLEGHLKPESASEETFTLDGSTSENAIETHPDFLSILAVYGNGHQPDPKTGRMVWDLRLTGRFAQSNVNIGGDFKNPMFGVDSYFLPSLVWTRHSVQQVLPGSLVADLGVISAPPGNPPHLSGGRNWLKVRAAADYRGNIWQIQESWALSGPRGWDAMIYRNL